MVSKIITTSAAINTLAALFASLALAVTTDLAKYDYLVIAAAYFDNMRTHKKRISL